MRYIYLILLALSQGVFASGKTKTNDVMYLASSRMGSCEVGHDGSLVKCKKTDVTPVLTKARRIVINHARTHAYISGGSKLFICPINADKSMGKCKTATDSTIHNIITLSINTDDSSIYLVTNKLKNHNGHTSVEKTYVTVCHINLDQTITDCTYVKDLESTAKEVRDSLINQANNRIYLFGQDNAGSITYAINADNTLTDCKRIFRAKTGLLNQTNDKMYIANMHGIYVANAHKDGSLTKIKDILRYDPIYQPSKLLFSKDKTNLYLINSFFHKIYKCPIDINDNLGTCKFVVAGQKAYDGRPMPDVKVYPDHSNQGLFTLGRSGAISYYHLDKDAISSKNVASIAMQYPIEDPDDYDFPQPTAMATNYNDSIAYFTSNQSLAITYCDLIQNRKLLNCKQSSKYLNHDHASSIVLNSSNTGLYLTNKGDYYEKPSIMYCPLNDNGDIGACRKIMQGKFTVHLSKTGHYVYLSGDGRIQRCEIDKNNHFTNCKLFDSYDKNSPWFNFSLLSDGSGVYRSLVKNGSTINEFCRLNEDGSKGECTDKGTVIYNNLTISNNNLVYKSNSSGFKLYKINTDNTLQYIGEMQDAFYDLTDAIFN